MFVAGVEAKRLFDEGQSMLSRIVSERSLSCRAVFGFWRANADGDDIHVYDDANDHIETFFGLRQQVRFLSSVSVKACLLICLLTYLQHSATFRYQ